jgi:hypothetical protein
MGYYLVDGVYPDWATFVKTTRQHSSEFAKAQEVVRKDIERAFGVLQARFAIVRGPTRFWDMDTFSDIMTICVILPNMIIEDERGLNLSFFFDNVGTRVKHSRNPNTVQAFLGTYRLIESDKSAK